MTMKTLASSLAVALSLSIAATFAHAQPATSATSASATNEAVQLQQIRNATVKITYGDTTFLIDPMLSKKGTYPGFDNTYRSNLRNPLVDLPMSEKDVIADVDAVIITHTHLDHWDDAAQQLLPKDIPLFVQNLADALMIRGQGFTNVRVLSKAEFEGVTLSQIGGQHGTDEMYAVAEVATALGEAMGVVFQSPGHDTLYLVGDTVWRDEVDMALADYAPQIVLINAGYAMMNGFDGSIIMGKEDVLRAAKTAPDATIVATHMDAINHMALTREELQSYVQEKGIADRVEIPEDGATLNF
ncbi:MBL fold metallo-hydrolase [Halopseudomonas bauzanensis]|uniref:L-ascorbate metabolism protein UlaG, beta-lactamase superfamily n=1 Tax=Halopseudomonas bauzanensis TaxID=653930 RepID=A0A1H9TZU9_9GAMM|nr:MBL fold metallo-hydrolase [Halopseudomonas bauzanensis]SES02528.1 L-ascorbate metabolism protein UlaG, beta-lactamase superfamily [Halopseudomonas bauzanensis]SFM03409.1 L-ascorbate metabolism protein UlaG, beta-lactamase superfamily [Halopseudomonas bauzanensis]